MKLSIIIACYNIEQYIRRCLDSIIPQLTPDIEVVVINDGATDRSAEIAKSLIGRSGGNLRIADFPNGGLATARNRGIDLTSGEYIWFVDGDDFISPHALGRLLQTIESCQADIIAFNHKVNDSEGLRCEGWFADATMTSAQFLSQGSRLYAWNKIYHRSLFDDFRFPDGLRNIEDFVFNLSISPAVGKVRTLKDYLYVYERTNVGSISMNRSPRHLVELSRETFRAHKILIDRFKTVSDPQLRKVWKRLLTTSYVGNVFSMVRFYNCRFTRTTIQTYRQWGVYPFPYTGNLRETAFSFFANHPILWPLHRYLKRFIP